MFQEVLMSINPHNGEIYAEHKQHQVSQIDSLLETSYTSFLNWRLKSFSERQNQLMSLSQLLLNNKLSLAKVMTKEMGKPISQSLAEIEKCASLCDYYCQLPKDSLDNEPVDSKFSHSYISYQPLGVVLAIMPWNFPFWQVFRSAIPILLSGNTYVLKHSENVSLCADEITKLFEQIGLNSGEFTSIKLHKNHGAYLVEHAKIAAVTMTGSTEGGKIVAQLAAKTMKKGLFELGGNDPLIVLSDADISLAIKSGIKSRLLNAGQSCIAAKRFIIHKEVYKEFKNQLLEKWSAIKFANPMDETTQLGPLARKDLQLKAQEQINLSIDQGAQCLIGGNLPSTKGFYYPPTLIENVTPECEAFNQEIFAPVISLILAENNSHAIELANKSSYGLGASLFSKDIQKAQNIIEKEIQSGCGFINDFSQSDPRLPFGGIKESGYGRELGFVGLKEFVNIKTVCVK